MRVPRLVLGPHRYRNRTYPVIGWIGGAFLGFVTLGLIVLGLGGEDLTALARVGFF